MAPNGVRKHHHAELGHQAKHMPVVGVGFSIKRYVVDPHVEVRPVDANEEHKAAQASVATGPWKNEAYADGDLHHAGDEHPNRWITQHGRHDGFEPSGVGKVLHADVNVHPSEDSREDWENPPAHELGSGRSQVKFAQMARQFKQWDVSKIQPTKW